MSYRNIGKHIKKVFLCDTEIKDMKADRDDEIEQSHSPKRGKVREQYRMHELIEQARLVVFFLILCAMLLTGIFLKMVFG